jgi:hypothetical protein
MVSVSACMQHVQDGMYERTLWCCCCRDGLRACWIRVRDALHWYAGDWQKLRHARKM